MDPQSEHLIATTFTSGPLRDAATAGYLLARGDEKGFKIAAERAKDRMAQIPKTMMCKQCDGTGIVESVGDFSDAERHVTQSACSVCGGSGKVKE